MTVLKPLASSREAILAVPAGAATSDMLKKERPCHPGVAAPEEAATIEIDRVDSRRLHSHHRLGAGDLEGTTCEGCVQYLKFLEPVSSNLILMVSLQPRNCTYHDMGPQLAVDTAVFPHDVDY